jgi:carboxylate-amine ligase
VSPELGATLGIEEEYHLVDPQTLRLIRSAPLVESLAPTGRLRAEMLTSQLEAATDPCASLGELRAALGAARREAAAAAQPYGAALLATSTHPFAGLDEIEVLARPRYERLIERFGTVVHQLNLTGCHVHVSVPDLETAVAILTRARPYLPLLLALTASSPFHAGRDTGYASFRVAWLPLWPQGGPPPHLHDAQHYLDTVQQLIELGLIEDATNLLWEARPSVKYPTVEFRIADVCTDLDDAVLYAALVRSLVRTLGARVRAGTPVPEISDAVLRAARWRAARYGLADSIWSPARAALVPAHLAVDDLLEELRPDLEEHGEDRLVRGMVGTLLGTGTSATRQRQVFAATGNLLDVARWGADLTAPA